MGTRINITIHYGDENQHILLLSGNSSHPNIDFDDISELLKQYTSQPTSIARLLLSLKYPSTYGNHTINQPIFSMNEHHPDPDIEWTLPVTCSTPGCNTDFLKEESVNRTYTSKHSDEDNVVALGHYAITGEFTNDVFEGLPDSSFDLLDDSDRCANCNEQL